MGATLRHYTPKALAEAKPTPLGHIAESVSQD